MARKNAELREVAQGHTAFIRYTTTSETILRLTSDLTNSLMVALEEEAVAIDIQLQVLLEHYVPSSPSSSSSSHDTVEQAHTKTQSLFRQIEFLEHCLSSPQNLIETYDGFLRKHGQGTEAVALFHAVLTDETINKQYRFIKATATVRQTPPVV
jgi:hypothetical protein